MPTAAGLYFAEHKAPATPYPPLLLVHGAGGSHFDWPPELRRLPDTRVIALDLPGHGKSAGPGRTDTRTYAADVCQLLDALEIDRAILAGHSMGGAIAQQIALNRADRVAGLVLIGTGSKLPVDPTLPQRIVDKPEHTIDWIIDWAWSANAPADLKALGRQRLAEMPTAILRGDYLACQAFDVRDRLDQITAPALVLGATGDRMVPLKFSRTLGERIPNTSLVIIEDAGHMFPLEQPRQVARAIQDWLSEVEW